MGHSEIALAIASLLTAATPVVAQGGSLEKAGKTAVASEETKYCIKYDDMTGSRIAREECRTKKDWARRDIDVDEFLKNEKKK